ncbi:MAG TPA: UDP-glucuronic acid decarboxylase family protein [Gemmatimonadales bacterium]|nr:UDP-glucuronic acid decarboxylase family protein [Gemmatimonadales bacterium]
MKVLVTGGAGFIGSHLSERLLSQGHEVVCLDNFFTGRQQNIRHLRDCAGFRLLRQDVCEPLLLDVDQIYNLACPASPVHYQYNPIKTIKSNVIGTLNMLVLAGRVGARVLQASTSEVYGEPKVHPQPESYWGNVNPVGPRSCYDEGKRVAETLMLDYHRHRGVDVRVARIFNTYGPRMAEHDGRVVSNFVVQALRGEPLTLYGDGSQTRSFCYVDDLVEGLIRLMETAGVHEPVNLGNPREFTIRELAARVADACGRSHELTYRARPQDDPTQRRPDISRARSLLGWQPTVSLEEGLPRTVTYFRHWLARRRRRPRSTPTERSLAQRLRAYGGPPD